MRPVAVRRQNIHVYTDITAVRTEGNSEMGLNFYLTFGGTNQRQEGDGGPDGAEQVDVDHLVEIFNGAPFDLGPVGDSSVVYDRPQAWKKYKIHTITRFCLNK